MIPPPYKLFRRRFCVFEYYEGMLNRKFIKGISNNKYIKSVKLNGDCIESDIKLFKQSNLKKIKCNNNKDEVYKLIKSLYEKYDDTFVDYYVEYMIESLIKYE